MKYQEDNNCFLSLPKIQPVSKKGLSSSKGCISDWGVVEEERFRSKTERDRKESIILKIVHSYHLNEEYKRIMFFTARDIYMVSQHKDCAILTRRYPAKQDNNFAQSIILHARSAGYTKCTALIKECLEWYCSSCNDLRRKKIYGKKAHKDG